MSDSAEASSIPQSASAARLARVSFQTGRASSDIDPSETRDTLPDYESAPPTQHELNGQDDTEPEVREYRASLEGKRERRPTKASCLICFSDVDGTIVHYHDQQSKWGEITTPSVVPGCFMYVEKATGKRHKVLKLPPSSTGAVGCIAINALTDLAAIRSGGVKLVLVSGARAQTLLQRLPYLPAADAFVCENGGRIFYPHGPLPTALPLQEDMGWRKQLNEWAGAPSEEGRSPSQRTGLLWDLYRNLKADDWQLDAHSYTTMFRFVCKPPKTQKDLEKVLQQLPEGLSFAYNVGAADVFPTESGKENAAKHLMARWDAQPDSSFFLCDDDNDLGLARLVGQAFLPGTTHENIRKAAEEDPEHFRLAKRTGVLGTAEVLDMVRDHIGTFVLG